MTTEVTVAQLIAALQKLPQEAIVRVGKEYTNRWETRMDHEHVDIEYQDVHDFRGEKWKHCAFYGKILVDLKAQ